MGSRNNMVMAGWVCITAILSLTLVILSAMYFGETEFILRLLRTIIDSVQKLTQ